MCKDRSLRLINNRISNTFTCFCTSVKIFFSCVLSKMYKDLSNVYAGFYTFYTKIASHHEYHQGIKILIYKLTLKNVCGTLRTLLYDSTTNTHV